MPEIHYSDVLVFLGRQATWRIRKFSRLSRHFFAVDILMGLF